MPRLPLTLTLIALATALLATACGNSSSQAIGDGPCDIDPYSPQNYPDYSTPEQRQSDLDQARSTVKSNNLNAHDPGPLQRVGCGQSCKPQSYCPQVLQACNATDATSANQDCIWRVQYRTDDGYTDHAVDGDGNPRYPVAMCDCD